MERFNLRNKDVVGFPPFLPLRPAEQQRIASCLSRLDALITAETQKHEPSRPTRKA